MAYHLDGPRRKFGARQDHHLRAFARTFRGLSRPCARTWAPVGTGQAAARPDFPRTFRVTGGGPSPRGCRHLRGPPHRPAPRYGADAGAGAAQGSCAWAGAHYGPSSAHLHAITGRAVHSGGSPHLGGKKQRAGAVVGSRHSSRAAQLVSRAVRSGGSPHLGGKR